MCNIVYNIHVMYMQYLVGVTYIFMRIVRLIKVSMHVFKNNNEKHFIISKKYMYMKL